MTEESLAAALEREHREIDEGVDAFTAAAADGRVEPEPLRRAAAGLRRHIYLEEELLFPSLRAAGLVMPVFVMVREHEAMWQTLEALDRALADGAQAAALLAAGRELAAQLEAHNPKEEQILYPQADRAVEPYAADRLAAFLAAGTTPDGWVCEALR